MALVVLTALASGCASTGPSGPPDPRTMVPPGIPGEWLHFSDTSAVAGQRAPEFELVTADGQTRLGTSNFLGRPLVLVFGSRT